MKFTSILFTCFLVLILVACQASPPSTPTRASSLGANAFRVALLLPRTIDADAWTRTGYQGLLLIERELGAEISYEENIPEAEFAASFREYANAEYDFIIGHGTQFVAAAEVVAAEFPRIAFAISGRYEGNNSNLGALSLREGEMAYLFGAIAAIKSESGRVGYIGGADNISQQEITSLYQRGAMDIDSDIQISVNMVGDFTDSATAENLAQAQIEAGVDVILVIAGAAGTGIHAQAQAAGIFSLAWIEDLHELAPQAVITSNIQDVSLMLLQGASLAEQGRWEGQQYKFGMAEGVQRLAPFYGMVTAEEEAEILQLQEDILTRRINTLP